MGIFCGMLGVTAFGIFFTPVFDEVIRGLTDRRASRRQPAAEPVAHETKPAAPRGGGS